MANKKVGEVDLPAIFAQKERLPLVFEAVQSQLANARRGTVSTKIRSEVRGGGKKPYRQKGTGRARHGSSRSPIFVGGGTTFGPRPRDYGYALPQKARRAALCSVLSIKQKEQKVLVVDKWECDSPKTKPMAQALKNLGVESGLIVLEGPDANIQKAMRNLRDIKVIPQDTLNAHDLLRFEHVVFTKAALERLQLRLSS